MYSNTKEILQNYSDFPHNIRSSFRDNDGKDLGNDTFTIHKDHLSLVTFDL